MCVVVWCGDGDDDVVILWCDVLCVGSVDF